MYSTPMEDRGFTLLEILIATALTAILVAAFYSTFFSVVRFGGGSEDSLDELLNAGMFFDRISKDIHSAFYRSKNRNTFFVGDIDGTTSSIAFTTLYRPPMRKETPSGDLRAVRYFAEREKDGYTLYMEVWNPYYRDRERFRVAMMEGVRGFEVSFFSTDWVEVWDSELEGSLPSAVKIAVTLRDGRTLSTITRTMIGKR